MKTTRTEVGIVGAGDFRRRAWSRQPSSDIRAHGDKPSFPHSALQDLAFGALVGAVAADGTADEAGTDDNEFHLHTLTLSATERGLTPMSDVRPTGSDPR